MSIFWVIALPMIAFAAGFMTCAIASAGSRADDAMDHAITFAKGKEAGLEEARREWLA